MSIQYRPEIDGLRAIAVLSVLLCHAGFTPFGGGYVGVDIFFVISGFLITSLIAKDLQAGSFSFTGFWERRIRRILPPLLVMVVTSAIAGWFLYLPGDYDSFGQQVAAQAVFASNILFKSQAGYFDVENITKPLLHTWSLAVEEQFYFFFPVAMFALWKYRREKLFKYLMVFAVISFLSASFIVHNSPTSAFYLLPFRAWELLLGTYLALRPKVHTGQAKEWMGFAGVAAILVGVLSYDDKTLFPGFSALLPCLGAAMIIASNTGERNSVGHLLAMRGPVFIGLVSYSLYLWHWPILAFVHYGDQIEFSAWVATACMAAAFLLAVLSWKYIERPVRQKKIFKTTRGIYCAGLVSLLVLGAGGFTIHMLKGVPRRLPTEVVQYAAGAQDINPFRESCNKPDFKRFENNTICQSNPDASIKPSFVVWGDSFADAVAPAFYDLSKEYKKNGYILTAHGCGPILGYRLNQDLAFKCIEFNKRVLNLIEQKKIRQVFLIANWTDRMRSADSLFVDKAWYKNYEKDYDDITSAGLKHTVDELQKRNVTVYIVIDVPGLDFNAPQVMAMNALHHREGKTSISVATYQKQRQHTIDEFIAKNKKSGIIFIDPGMKLCDATICRASDEGHSLYFDSEHLSAYGAVYMKGLFEEYFKHLP